MTTYRLCLLGPTGRIAKVRRFCANTDEGALVMPRDILRADEPLIVGFELWNGSRRITVERKRVVAILRGRDQLRAARRSRSGPSHRRPRTEGGGDGRR